jgi:hypothetical protein
MSKIYIIRGVQVMLDFDLAAIYGYTTKNFNRQVKNNIDRFDEELRFQLTDTELENLRCNFCTSSFAGPKDDSLRSKFSTSSWGGIYQSGGMWCSTKTLSAVWRGIRCCRCEHRSTIKYCRCLMHLCSLAHEHRCIGGRTWARFLFPQTIVPPKPVMASISIAEVVPDRTQ